MADEIKQTDLIRVAVEQAAPTVRCADCLGVLRLKRGRCTGKWFWVHVTGADCVNYSVAHAIFFATREEAEAATEVFE